MSACVFEALPPLESGFCTVTTIGILGEAPVDRFISGNRWGRRLFGVMLCPRLEFPDLEFVVKFKSGIVRSGVTVRRI